jgi:hypothetical protein
MFRHGLHREAFKLPGSFGGVIDEWAMDELNPEKVSLCNPPAWQTLGVEALSPLLQ